jgi:hypothetical protein
VQDVWSGWSDSGAISHSITVPSTATTYTASFTTQYQLTTAANPTIGGTVTPASGNYYAAGTIVSLNATPNANYAFSNWTGSVANPSSAATTVTMNAPQSVTANFVASTTPGVTASPTSLNFGDVKLCQSKKEILTLLDDGTKNVLIGPVSFIDVVGNPADFSFKEYCNGGVLGPKRGHSCTFAVEFSPSEAAPESATLNIVTNAPGSPVQVPLTGTGIATKSCK